MLPNRIQWICFDCARFDRRDTLLIGLAQRMILVIFLMVAGGKMILYIASLIEEAHDNSRIRFETRLVLVWSESLNAEDEKEKSDCCLKHTAIRMRVPTFCDVHDAQPLGNSQSGFCRIAGGIPSGEGRY